MHDLCSTAVASDKLGVIRVRMGGSHATIIWAGRDFGIDSETTEMHVRS